MPRDFQYCCGCQTSLPESDLIQYDGYFVCIDCKDEFIQKVWEGINLNHAVYEIKSKGIFRNHMIVMLREDSKFPNYCIHCGNKSTTTVNHELSYYDSSVVIAVVIVLVVPLVIFPIITCILMLFLPLMLLLKKKIFFKFPCCDSHKRASHSLKKIKLSKREKGFFYFIGMDARYVEKLPQINLGKK